MSKAYYRPPRDNHARPTTSGVVLDLPSGFTVRVRPMPPYYLDVVDDAMPLPEYPKRSITLVAGDVIYVDYTPPEQAPNADHEDYDLYMRWLAIDQARRDIGAARKRARMDFLLSTCVDILKGPLDYRNPGWIPKVEAAFPDYQVPEHKGKRLLIFLKTFVISSPDWMEIILRSALAEEATMQGITTALRGFQDNARQGFLMGFDKSVFQEQN